MKMERHGNRKLAALAGLLVVLAGCGKGPGATAEAGPSAETAPAAAPLPANGPHDEPPVINLVLDEETVKAIGERKMDLADGAPSWHFEHDALLGEPERARFRLRVGGRTFVPDFHHTHAAAGHGGGEETPEPHSASQVHAEGPNGGRVIHLGSHLAHLEYTLDENWGVVRLWLHDDRLRPMRFDRRPVINALLDDESVVILGAKEDDEGNAVDGWYFEDTALLGLPERTRFRLEVGGRTFTPDLLLTNLGHHEEPGHSHGCREEADHSKCDPALCPLAPQPGE
jgi:hypothetical protein